MEEAKLVTPLDSGEHNSADQKHRDKCTICQSKVSHQAQPPGTLSLSYTGVQVVKPIVETDISRAASSFAKDSTLIKYSWRNEKATFTEKNVEIRTDKLPGNIMVLNKQHLDS